MSGVTPDSLSESSRGLPVINDEPGLRRAADRILYSACGLVIVLVGLVWALTWTSTRASVTEVNTKTQELDKEQRQHAERLKVLEIHHQDTKEALNDLKKGQVEVLDILRKK